MKRIREIQAANRDQFELLVRGEKVASAVPQSVNAGTKQITFPAGTDLGSLVPNSGYILVDTVTKRAAKITGVAGMVVTLDEWTLTAAVNRCNILLPPVKVSDFITAEFDEGRPVVYVRQEDGIIRELDADRVTVMWRKASEAPAGARDYSFPFYVKPGVEKICLELPFTHANDIFLQRYYGDWLSLHLNDTVLAPQNVTGWSDFPLPSLAWIAGAVAAGSYVFGGVTQYLPPGFYRLRSTTAGADVTYTVVTVS